jgi:hypothetical protein
MKTSGILLLTTFLLAAALARAGDGEGRFSIHLRERGFDERCLRLDAGESIRYRFSASAPVDFNIHYHRGKEVFYPVTARATRAADARYSASHADTYCLMWERAGDGPAIVDGSVDRVAHR